MRNNLCPLSHVRSPALQISSLQMMDVCSDAATSSPPLKLLGTETTSPPLCAWASRPLPSQRSGSTMESPPFSTLAFTSPPQSLIEMPPFCACAVSLPVLRLNEIPPFCACASAVPVKPLRETPPLWTLKFRFAGDNATMDYVIDGHAGSLALTRNPF